VFSAFLRCIGRDRPLYVLDAGWLRNREPIPPTVQRVAAQGALQIRRVQQTGPYRLYGPRDGGTLAFEVARRLRADGDEVAVVAMLDAEAIVEADPHLCLDPALTAPLDANVVLMSTDAPEWNGTRLQEAWKPFVSGRMTVHSVPAVAPDACRLERHRAVGAVLARVLTTYD